MNFSLLAQAQVPQIGLPKWQGKLIILAAIGIIGASAWALSQVLPPKFQRPLSTALMVLGSVSLIFCAVFANDLVEHTPTWEAIFVGVLFGGPFIGMVGLLLRRNIKTTEKAGRKDS